MGVTRPMASIVVPKQDRTQETEMTHLSG